MVTITFDRNCSSWRNEDYVNQFVLDKQLQYINEVLEVRRYLYLSSIYEQLGAKWNPEWKNICYLAEFGELYYEIERDEENESYLVKIYQ
jgi:hypothetical protein